MKRAGFKIIFALAVICVRGFSVSEAGSGIGDCKSVADKIARFAETNGINRISVLGFTGKGGAERNETDYITERISAYLAGRAKPALIERALLEKVLKEARLSSSAGGPEYGPKILSDVFSIDAVVTGTVFAAGDKLKILAKLIDARSGRVLLAAQAEAEREWPQFPEVPDMGFKWGSADWPPASDFRDSVSDSPLDQCSERKRRLRGINSRLVDAKALFWAAKMKEPGFSIRGLSRNPGTEISDPGIKARFYSLLNAYYKAENAPPPDPGKLSGLMDLMEEENAFYNECGSR